MKLIDALDLINTGDEFDPLMTVYAKKPWSTASPTIITPQPVDGRIAPIDDHDYFLEVFIIRDWLVDLGSVEVSQETCNRIIEYAINDA